MSILPIQQIYGRHSNASAGRPLRRSSLQVVEDPEVIEEPFRAAQGRTTSSSRHMQHLNAPQATPQDLSALDHRIDDVKGSIAGLNRLLGDLQAQRIALVAGYPTAAQGKGKGNGAPDIRLCYVTVSSYLQAVYLQLF